MPALTELGFYSAPEAGALEINAMLLQWTAAAVRNNELWPSPDGKLWLAIPATPTTGHIAWPIEDEHGELWFVLEV